MPVEQPPSPHRMVASAPDVSCCLNIGLAAASTTLCAGTTTSGSGAPGRDEVSVPVSLRDAAGCGNCPSQILGLGLRMLRAARGGPGEGGAEGPAVLGFEGAGGADCAEAVVSNATGALASTIRMRQSANSPLSSSGDAFTGNALRTTISSQLRAKKIFE